MIADRDIWRAANLLITEHLADAAIVATVRRQQSGLAKELGLGRGRRACRE